MLTSFCDELSVPAAWRWLVIALAALTLSACRSTLPEQAPATASLSDRTEPGELVTRGQSPTPLPFQQLPGGRVQQVQHQTRWQHQQQAPGNFTYGPDLVEVAPPVPSPAPCPCCNPGAPGGVPCETHAAPGFGAGGPSTFGGYDARNPYPNPDAPWRPVGIRGPWPRDEYLCDGGDQETPTAVGRDFAVYGLDVEDTVVHFDTIDGRRLVEPSNKVCVYAPRFSSVRQVKGMFQHDFALGAGRIDDGVGLVSQEENLGAERIHQNLQPVGQIGRKPAVAFRERIAGVGIENAQALAGSGRVSWLHTDKDNESSVIWEASEKVRLSQQIANAIVWTHEKGVQIVIDEQRLAIDTHDTKLGEVIVFDHEGVSRMEILKTASVDDARPGEVVEFTLQFKNVGSDLVGNVTIIDNLTTRLEYVAGSSTCSLDHNFFTEPNEGESLGLRWEIIDPMEPGETGVIRFKCRVR